MALTAAQPVYSGEDFAGTGPLAGVRLEMHAGEDFAGAGSAQADAAQGPLLEMARRHFERQENVKALKAYTRLVDSDPAHEAGCWGKVVTLQRLNRPRGALKACAAALGHLPRSPQLLALREELCVELGDESLELCGEFAPTKASFSETNEEQYTDCEEDPESKGEVYTDCESTASEDEGPAPCPASKSQARVEREARRLKARVGGHQAPEAEPRRLDSEASVAWREATKARLLNFYRDFYGRTRSPETSQYTKAEKSGLSIKEGHRPMPRPEHVEVPADHRQSVGVLAPVELASLGSGTDGRLLLSLHGDVFDVSDRPDKYGPEGPYSSMAGRDITWPLWSGYDTDEELDKYFDLHRAAEKEQRDRRFQGLMSWWVFFEQEYGSPVGRLDVYDREWELPAPPAVEDMCTVM